MQTHLPIPFTVCDAISIWRHVCFGRLSQSLKVKIRTQNSNSEGRSVALSQVGGWIFQSSEYNPKAPLFPHFSRSVSPSKTTQCYNSVLSALESCPWILWWGQTAASYTGWASVFPRLCFGFCFSSLSCFGTLCGQSVSKMSQMKPDSDDFSQLSDSACTWH